MGPPPTLFPNFMLLCKRFHSISVLTADFQAAPDTFPHPLNHLTAIFFKTSTFCLLAIYHPPFLHLPFFTHFHLPLCLQAAMEMMAPSAASPHISQGQVPAITDGFANHSWGRTQPSNNHLEPVRASPRASILPITIAIELIQCHWGKTQFPRNPRSLGLLQSCWFWRALLNDKLPGHHKDLAANSPTRAKSTFSTKDAACEMQ